MIHTAEWALKGTPVFGPDGVSYQETPIIGIRLDGAAYRQGPMAMEWRYQVLPIAELSVILSIWEETYPVTTVRWLTPGGVWMTSPWCMQQPQIGRRSGYHAYDLVIRFTPVSYTGAGLATSTGTDPTIYTGFNAPNPLPVARISYTAAIVGDPQVVVTVDGRGSTDADGVVTAYTWTDNAAIFQSVPGYPAFETPHEFTTATATFVYPYAAAMPHPVITLAVADNAGQTGSTSITIDVQALIALLPTKGKRMVMASGGTAYISTNGGLDFAAIPHVSGVTTVAGAGGYIVIGTESGDVYVVPNDALDTAQSPYRLSASVVCIAVSAQDTASVAIIAVDGSLAVSSSSGRSFRRMASPLTAGVSCAWNQDVANEIGVVGDLVAYTRNAGTAWTVDTAGLPGASWTSSQREIRIRYAGGSAGLFAATGSAWIASEVTGSVTAISAGHNDIGVAAGTRVYRVTETTVVSSTAITGTVHRMVRDPNDASFALLATSAGLYKTLDTFATVGVFSFDGMDVGDADFLRDGVAGGGVDILLPVSGTVGIRGVWQYTAETGWVRKNGTGNTLPAGLIILKVVADPFDRNRWAALGNTPAGGEYGYTAGGVICAGTAASPLYPLWITEDLGATWNPVIITMYSHTTHTDHGNLYEWAGVGITDMEFDRRNVRGLFVFGYASVPVDAAGKIGYRHGMVWHGTGTSVYAASLANGTARYESRWLYPNYSTESEVFWSAEGGPDGGIVAITGNSSGFNRYTGMILEWTDPGLTTINRNPGGFERNIDQRFTALERRPTFGSFAVVVITVENGTYTVYGTSDYKKVPLSLLTYVEYRRWLKEVSGTPSLAFFTSMTYAIDAVYFGGGMGVVSMTDPFTSEASEIYAENTYFSEVRCDRQWRKAVAAMAYLDRVIHVKTDVGWTQVPLPPGVFIHTGAGMEVLGS